MDEIVNLGLSAFTGKKGGYQCSLCGKASKNARLFKSEVAITAHLKDYHKILVDEIEGHRDVEGDGDEAEGDGGGGGDEVEV